MKQVMLKVTASTKQGDDILGFVQTDVPFEIPDDDPFQDWIVDNTDAVADVLAAMQLSVMKAYAMAEHEMRQAMLAQVDTESIV